MAGTRQPNQTAQMDDTAGDPLDGVLDFGNVGDVGDGMRAYLMGRRQSLFMELDIIERTLGMAVRTAEIRRALKHPETLTKTLPDLLRRMRSMRGDA